MERCILRTAGGPERGEPALSRARRPRTSRGSGLQAARPACDILFVSGTPHLPQARGGVEVNTHELALELALRGRRPGVFAKLSLRDAFGCGQALRGLATGRGIGLDERLGYPVYRSRQPWASLDGLPLPRAAVIQNGNMVPLGRLFAERGVPAIAYLHGLEFEHGARRWGGEADDLPFSAYIANSRFTAERLSSRFGLEARVIPPVFRSERYRTNGGGRFATFINPVPEKGLTLALAIAERCPEIPFRFVRGWPLTPRAALRLRRICKAAGNIELVDSVTDMRPVYADTRVLLVPSQWQAETWGRVASEAQFSGIPVLASRVGGLPESVGPGGLLLPHDGDPALWADALRRLWSDEPIYQDLSRAASAHAARPDLDVAAQVDALLAAVDAVT